MRQALHLQELEERWMMQRDWQMVMGRQSWGLKSSHQTPTRVLHRMRSPEELEAEGCEQIDIEWCLFFFLYVIHQGPERRSKVLSSNKRVLG